MNTTECTAEVLAYEKMMVSSRLATMRMVSGALATTSTYSRVVRSQWERDTRKMEGDGLEAQNT